MSKLAYSIKEVAAVASVEKSTVVLAIQDGQLLARAVGGTAIVTKADIKAWLQALPHYPRVIG